MRPPVLRLHADDMIVDNFAGGGGASTGIERALGRSPDIAINHNPQALAMHEANHPKTHHLCEDVFDVDPVEVCGRRPVAIAWFSPDCTFHSRARGGKPFRDRNKARRRRGLAGVVIRWAKAVKPRIILLENVQEFQHWGPLTAEGVPDPARRGFNFRRWWAQLVNAGYQVEMRELSAHHYGAPTIRKRLFIVARSDGLPIVWPEPSHGPGRTPYRTAAECIDWTIPCPSIFGRKKPLAENTLKRIARGLQRFVFESGAPFIAPVKTWGGGGNEPRSIGQPMRTITTSKRGEFALVAPQLIQTGYGERKGQAPRVFDIQKPHPTVVGGGTKTALVAAFISRYYGGRGAIASSAQLPLPTITAWDHNAVVTSHLLKFKGTCKDGQSVAEPMPTVQAMGNHVAEVRAFLVAYFGNEKDGGQLSLPMRTVTTRDRFALVTVHGVDYVLADIGLRMLTKRELFRAQGFSDSYIIDPPYLGKPLSQEAQGECCGNSVCPDLADALVRAQLIRAEQREVANG